MPNKINQIQFMLITTGQTDSRFGYIMSELNILPRIFLVMVIILKEIPCHLRLLQQDGCTTDNTTETQTNLRLGYIMSEYCKCCHQRLYGEYRGLPLNDGHESKSVVTIFSKE